jgi:hypothetical protein
MRLCDNQKAKVITKRVGERAGQRKGGASRDCRSNVVLAGLEGGRPRSNGAAVVLPLVVGSTHTKISWGDLPIFYLLPCAHPTWPNRQELSPGCMGWSWNRHNLPEWPLWPRSIISRRPPRHRAAVGPLPPSPEQRVKAVHRWVRVSNRHAARVIAGNSRPWGGLSCWGASWGFGIHQYRPRWLLHITNLSNH